VSVWSECAGVSVQCGVYRLVLISLYVMYVCLFLCLWEITCEPLHVSIPSSGFEMEDGPGVCRESISLDLSYHSLLFAHESGFNIEQIKVFWNIMEHLMKKLRDVTCTQEDCWQYFKDRVLLNSPLGSHFRANSTASSQDIRRMNETLVEQAIDTAVRERSKKSKKLSKAAKAKAEAAAAAAAAAEAAEHAENANVSLDDAQSNASHGDGEGGDGGNSKLNEKASKMFTIENVKQITDFATEGLFKHFNLYQCVFNSDVFQPLYSVETHHFRMENVVIDNLRLSNAVDMEAEEEKQKIMEAEQRKFANEVMADVDIAFEPELVDVANKAGGPAAGERRLDVEAVPEVDPVQQLVAAEVEKARESMMAILAQKEAELEARLEKLQLSSEPAEPKLSKKDKAKAEREEKQRLKDEAAAEKAAEKEAAKEKEKRPKSSKSKRKDKESKDNADDTGDADADKDKKDKKKKKKSKKDLHDEEEDGGEAAKKKKKKKSKSKGEL
jgi:hypothetical protein